MSSSASTQPSLDTVYNTASNPVSQNQEEMNTSTKSPQFNNGNMTDARERGDILVPSTHGGEPTSSSLGYGVRDASGDQGGTFGTPNTDADQMRAAGEGEIAKAQYNKMGFGEQHDLASDLDRKMAEQAGAREKIKEQRKAGVDIGGALGGIGGPAVVEGR